MAGIALLAALPFLSVAASGDFINLDDPQYVLSNPYVTHGLSAAGMRWALTAFRASNWHPLTWISHMADVSLFGLAARGHHVSSIFLHALSAALLFFALQRLTGFTGRSALVAILFGVHPLHVESVAWIAERKDVLAAFFFMLAVLAYERYCRRWGGWCYLTTLGLFALGLTAKPMLVTLPFLLLMFDFWPLGRLRFGRGGPNGQSVWRAILLEKTPFLLLAAVSGIVTLLANAVVSYAAYLHSTVWPARLAVHYPHVGETVHWPSVAAAALLLMSISLLALRHLTQRPFLAVGWCWFLGMLVPVIGLVQVGAQARADRYTYLPLIGIFLALAWLATEGTPALLRRPTVLVPAGVVIVTALSAAATAQVAFWRDSGTLFARTLAVTKDNWVIENNLATWLIDNGRPEEALAHAREALRILPGNPFVLSNLGNALAALGQRDEAIVRYREALKLRLDHPEAHQNLGISLAVLGRYQEALPHAREAVRLMPDRLEARYSLGNLLAALGQHEESVAQAREAVRISPTDAFARINLGNALAALGRIEEAAACYRDALWLRPDYADALYRLGNALAALGRYEEAAASYREALQHEPNLSAAREKLGALLEDGGRPLPGGQREP
jgi:tetratricopeptide (TPR) repeat protein